MKKWMIISFSIIVVLLGSAGGYYYFLTNKKVDLNELKKEDPKIAEIVEEEYEVLLPDDLPSSTPSGKEQQTASAKQNKTSQTNDNGDQSSQHNENKTNNKDGANKQQGGSDQQNERNDESGNNEQSEPSEQVTVASIKEKYRSSFEYLQQQAHAKIDALVDHAIGEYKEKKAAGQSVSFHSFFAKYNTAAQELEAKTDAAFNIVYNALENELKKHGFSPSHAKEFREAYEQEKSAQRNALLKKALSKL